MARGVHPAVTIVRLTTVQDFAALGVQWRDLEQRAAASFFQSWTWVGCLAEERFPDPVLVEATEDGRTVALALFNRVRQWIGRPVLYLSENGTAELDCPYVEQNGVLTEVGREAALTMLCLRMALRSYDLVLSGLREPQVAAVRNGAGLVSTRRTQASPMIDLAGVRARGRGYLAERSANTRQQIRRSNRLYERDGPIMLQRAETVAAAHAMLDTMAVLHQASWTSRGMPGSFAKPFFLRFHRALLAAAIPRGEVALFRFAGDDTVIGILYNFVYDGRVIAYQSGFAYQQHVPQAKPGLTCHCLAIEHALAHGFDVYDFLAGESRYKTSLADGAYTQTWLRAGSAWSPRLLIEQGLRTLRGRGAES